MKDEDKKKLLHLYEGRYDELKYDVKTIGWRDVESQRLRFKVLADIANLSGRSVCDLGCGFGDLYHYLKGRFNNICYKGIDLSEKLINEAKQRYPEVQFKVHDILEERHLDKVDYVLSSGALNFKVDDHENYLRLMLEAMMSMSRKGVAVNFLSSYVDYTLEKNYHFSPEEALSTGLKLTKYATLRHDYPLYEFTMYLYHSAV